MRRAVLLVAGGTGTRMGSAQPKQFLTLNGKPILIETLLRFMEWDAFMHCGIVIYPEARTELESLLQQHLPAELVKKISLANGGATRTISVWNGIQAMKEFLGAEDVWIAVQDAVRPLISADLLERNFNLAAAKGNAVSCVPVTSSLRIQEGESSRAVDRSQYWTVQTPQTFLLSALYHWLQQRPHDDFTDEASLAEYFGEKINLAEGSYRNLKITTPEDLYLARYLADPNHEPLS